MWSPRFFYCLKKILTFFISDIYLYLIRENTIPKAHPSPAGYRTKGAYMVTQRTYFNSKQAVYDYADALAAIMHSWDMITDYGYDSDNPEEPYYVETRSDIKLARDAIF